MGERNWYIVRTYSAGVFFGTISKRNGSELVMDNCQKIHYWCGAASIEQLAISGVKYPDKCRFTLPVNNSELRGWIQILPCTQQAITSLRGVPIWSV